MKKSLNILTILVCLLIFSGSAYANPLRGGDDVFGKTTRDNPGSGGKPKIKLEQIKQKTINNILKGKYGPIFINNKEVGEDQNKKIDEDMDCKEFAAYFFEEGAQLFIDIILEYDDVKIFSDPKSGVEFPYALKNCECVQEMFDYTIEYGQGNKCGWQSNMDKIAEALFMQVILKGFVDSCNIIYF